MTDTLLVHHQQQQARHNISLLDEIRLLENNFPQLNVIPLEKRLLQLMEQSTNPDKEQLRKQLILECLDFISVEEPDWTYAAAQLYLNQLYLETQLNRGTSVAYQGFSQLLLTLHEQGIYHSNLVEKYSEADISKIASYIRPEHDALFTYIGLRTLADRYLARDHQKRLYELPQERFMIIAMTLMQDEPHDKRHAYIQEAYWALSKLYMTVATPTLSNAGKTYGQLSSCFIDTVDDSLQGIYDSNTDIANLSKHGGGIGIYLGKIRSRGSSIKGFKGASSGVIPWMKQLNNTAVSVDQLGQRKGAISAYLDVWHKDILSFLDARLNNGDERLRTHDLFTGVCVPDLFMECVRDRRDWYLFDPYEVRRELGFSLEDCFDEAKGKGTFRERYMACVHNEKLSKEQLPAIEIMKRIMKSQLETGSPFMFYRDEVNRSNANGHLGMIYCTNLCTEITQNQSPTSQLEQRIEDGKIIIEKVPGDFVVCNLSSLNLGTVIKNNVLERVISIQVRMLDNVIDLNTIPVLQAELTNKKYRAIGLGTFGWHHLLSQLKVTWESDDAIQKADEIYERIAYHTIEASLELAKEKGVYPAYSGSDWQTKAYFEKRGYLTQTGSLDWTGLADEVAQHGVRNGYLMAIAPNSSTALIAGSTPSIDPIFLKYYLEEKKDYKIPVTVPELNEHSTWYYKSAYHIDQHWSIKQNAARQRHIDQSISFNIYVQNTIKAKELLDLHLHAWEAGLKTTYYVRSTSSEIEECESCAS